MTLTDIMGYLPYRILGYHEEGHICWIDIQMVAKYEIGLCNYRPVLRPMFDLTNEITEKGYNDGRPFVPIVKLVEAATGLVGGNVSNDIGIICKEVGEWIYRYSLRWHPIAKLFTFACLADNVNGFEYDRKLPVAWNQYQVYDLLHRWHFDYRGLIGLGDAIDIHYLKKNLYE